MQTLVCFWYLMCLWCSIDINSCKSINGLKFGNSETIMKWISTSCIAVKQLNENCLNTSDDLVSYVNIESFEVHCAMRIYLLLYDATVSWYNKYMGKVINGIIIEQLTKYSPFIFKNSPRLSVRKE